MKLLKDTKDNSKIDGVDHIPIQIGIHTLVSIIVWSNWGNLYLVMLSNWITLGIMGVYWIGAELYQEYQMCKKDPKRKFSFNGHRIQDVVMPEGAGSIFSGLITLMWLYL